MKTSSIRLVSLLSLALALVPTFRAAAGNYLKLDGIDGDANTLGHINEIEVGSFSFANTTVPANTNLPGAKGRNPGPPVPGDFVITKLLDVASVNLLVAWVNATTIKTAVLTATRTGANSLENYYIITLTNLRISNISQSGQGDRPGETISFRYGKIQWKYQAFNNTGSPSNNPITGGYDFNLNKSLDVQTNSAPPHVEASVSQKALAASFPVSPLK